jgi:hypothetical protein
MAKLTPDIEIKSTQDGYSVQYHSECAKQFQENLRNGYVTINEFNSLAKNAGLWVLYSDKI